MVFDIPENLRIIGKDYKITRKHKQGSVGECDDYIQEINVDPEYPLQSQQDTLLHEIIHAVDYAVKTKLSEEQVSALATGLYAVFNDNQHLLGWINERSGHTPIKANPRQNRRTRK